MCSAPGGNNLKYATASVAHKAHHPHAVHFLLHLINNVIYKNDLECWRDGAALGTPFTNLTLLPMVSFSLTLAVLFSELLIH